MIDEQLQALAGQDYTGPLEVIVVDNGSVDESAYLAGHWPNVKVVTALDRQSPNHARNVGANAASGDLILTCDADDVVAAHWVSAMAEGLKKFDLVGEPLDFALLNADTQRWPQRDHGLPLRYTFLPAATGANFGIRSSVLADLGGWDESFDGGPDDTELCWRAQLAGYDLGFAPGGSSTTGSGRQLPTWPNRPIREAGRSRNSPGDSVARACPIGACWVERFASAGISSSRRRSPSSAGEFGWSGSGGWPWRPASAEGCSKAATIPLSARCHEPAGGYTNRRSPDTRQVRSPRLQSPLVRRRL